MHQVLYLRAFQAHSTNFVATV